MRAAFVVAPRGVRLGAFIRGLGWLMGNSGNQCGKDRGAKDAKYTAQGRFHRSPDVLRVIDQRRLLAQRRGNRCTLRNYSCEHRNIDIKAEKPPSR